MQNISEEKIVELAKRAIQQIKESDNPYKNMSFVNTIFEDCSQDISEDIKNILKEKYNGQLNENLFTESALPAHKHLYNYLYENNLLSKYNLVAEYMNYPKANTLFEWESYDDGTDEDTRAAQDAYDQHYDPSGVYEDALNDMLYEIEKIHASNINIDKALNGKLFTHNNHPIMLKKVNSSEKAMKLFHLFSPEDLKDKTGVLKIYFNKNGEPVRLFVDSWGVQVNHDLVQRAKLKSTDWSDSNF